MGHGDGWSKGVNGSILLPWLKLVTQKFQNFIYRGCSWINLSPNVPTIPLSPSTGVSWFCQLSPWFLEEVHNSFWWSSCMDGSPETGHVASGRWPCVANGWFCPVGLVTISGIGGKRIGVSTRLFSNCGNQSWLGHSGAIITADILSLWSLIKQQGISANGGNM